MAKAQLTAADIKNGWTQEKLDAYMAEREKQQIDYQLEQAKHKPVKTETVDGYNPHNF